MTEIEQWLREGAGVQEGLRLLSKYRPNPYLSRMVESHPAKYRDLLVRALTGSGREAVASTSAGGRSFRENWPFLSDPKCPPELKILAADKITAWSNFAKSHDQLYSCLSPEQCLEVAKKCVFFYQQNRKIFSEFAHYKETGQILGKHPVFQETRRYREMLSDGPFELMRKRRNLQAAIWRLSKQIKDGTRPDLDAVRSELLQSKERELAEVEKILSNYERAYAKRGTD